MGKEFIEGYKNDVDKSIAEDLYAAMQDFVQYALINLMPLVMPISPIDCISKAHYPPEFMAALMIQQR